MSRQQEKDESSDGYYLMSWSGKTKVNCKTFKQTLTVKGLSLLPVSRTIKIEPDTIGYTLADNLCYLTGVEGYTPNENPPEWVNRVVKTIETKPKKYLQWTIKLEINMTDQNIIYWIHDTFGIGSVAKKPPGKGQIGKRMQWRWRCSHRDAYSICKLIWPYVKVKLHKIEQIIDHYEPEFAADQNVVNMDEYKMRKEMMWE